MTTLSLTRTNPADGRVVGVGEFEQFDWRAVFDYRGGTDAVGWAVRRNQTFPASKLGDEVSHFKRDVRNVPDEIGNGCARCKTHPLHAELAFLVADKLVDHSSGIVTESTGQPVTSPQPWRIPKCRIH